MNKNLGDIGERALLKMFEKLVDSGDLPFNDDAVAYSISENQSMVVNIDTFVRETDAPPKMTPAQMGSKAVTMTISDLAAKGVQPQVIVASGVFPGDFSVENTLELVTGIRETAHSYNTKFLGGDTNTAGDVILSIVALGLCQKKNLILRSGALIDDIICTTGYFGLTGAGFKVFLDNYSATEKQKNKFSSAIYEPKACLEEGLLFSQFGKINSCIDSSDGLAWSLYELLRNKNDLGIILENIPIDPTVNDFAKDHNLQAEDLALHAGEEFELLFTLKEDNFHKLQKLMESKGKVIHRIGRITNENPGLIQYMKEGKLIDVSPKGWEHFQ
ncbi:MAG: thiamine-phosphate kinase [Candidatus Heimdallarchaeota archaeon]|nr:thiamine-phosphate kinase [Candidatus Heimdallarchaeota archaeon]MBY8993192.1 thiamine-phosphate kinase [Candidatus Heimdallarchaeota archaeon]